MWAESCGLRVSVFGSIAYVSQTSWIQSGTIQDNILYGKPMDKTKYEKAIKACALDKDIEAFSHGDLTEIGQRGLNLSGGQKQRVQLARAVYNDADIYLLDDPFSAVDAHTAATLFNDCVMNCLEGKTVILVTHQVEFLSSVDNILVMQDGQIKQSGNYENILKAGTAFEELVNAHKEAITGLDSSSSSESKTMNKHQTLEENNNNYLEKENSEGHLLKGPPGVQLTEDEEKEIGNVGWKPFLDYVVISEGSWYLFLCVFTVSGFVALQAAASYWLAYGIQIPAVTTVMLISVYTLLSSVSTVFVFLRSIFAALLGLKASKMFFSKFTDAVFSAPMVFFDSTPVGRILTRASSDLSVIDFDIPFSFAFVIASSIELLAMILIMASVTWQVLIVAIFGILASKYTQLRYRPNAPLVLKGINCTFKEGTRVGIVGRTGSGKTTLITALFRLVEPDSGRILIDGLDICSIGLKDLRMNLSVIPQEPTLFRGSIRTNLDPLGLHSDDEIWKALEKCQLKTTIRNLPNLLDSSVSDEGENWSAGQRQLFCLGRVLLRRNKILILDEATASIDSATDVILQRIIREEFSSCTVITVAHRVPTVIDSDKVMVLSFGKMMEYDEPSKLMETDTFFSKLVAEYWSSCRRNSTQTLVDFQ
ncbi:hypothetical protein M8C21_007872 [Ambrosia artemisiifolia]|uniref:ABC-type xenobiotic transporter n=1 Tax=Ambrosia artemisiifolia TaxID=4212 RepID=A0AAD5BPC9_AMBAR|nr:hypothetical protein M8C21_007872 [Ambrosia artemisiifolia]